MSGGLIVRAPNHLGDLLMALPALEAAGAADVLVVRPLAPLLELAGFGSRLLAFDRGRRGFWRAVRALRGRRYARGVLLTPSFSSALLFAAGGVRERRGTATDRRRLFLTDPIPRGGLDGLHRSAAYWYLVTGERPAAPPTPRLRVPDSERRRWSELVGPAYSGDAGGSGPVGVFPGSNASSRRWDPERFAEVVRGLVARGERVVVFGGPGERELTARVAGREALDLGGRTDLPLLAAGLAACRVVLTNDSGPMHLAAAVGTPTVALFGAGNPAVTGPRGSGHTVLQRTELPCVPCVKNDCPRSGRGYILPEAERECLRLIEAADVVAALRAHGVGA